MRTVHFYIQLTELPPCTTLEVAFSGRFLAVFWPLGRVPRRVEPRLGHHNIGHNQVSFQWKNLDFLSKNPDFLLKNDEFIITVEKQSKIGFVFLEFRAACRSAAGIDLRQLMFAHTTDGIGLLAAVRPASTAKFINLFDTKLLVFNTQFIIFTHGRSCRRWLWRRDLSSAA